DSVRIQLQASDPGGAPLAFSSNLLPPGASLDPMSGLFEWTPEYTQHGLFNVPFTVSDGEVATTQTARIAVLNVNAAPIFSGLNEFQIHENQAATLRIQATDPDNPIFSAPDRNTDGSLAPHESGRQSVT